MENPCYGCTERYVTDHSTCHSTCEKYIKAKEKHDAKSALIRKNKDKYRNLYEYHADVSIRLNKKYHK